MASVTVRVHLINGGLQEWEEGPAFLAKLEDLRQRGFEGKRLVHELLTDDWGAPPTVVVITGSTPGFEEIRIQYV